ncbi:hypothetical protein PIB30_068071 [Stylosanthes scabra]|uniref:Secreted protein n=1 Tax=Stylosanthes scabra TaxID=79078 RepID=A0ABU6XL50_9FABA|nr:hypothetical protein [Stylosanthes scabra]
MVLVAATILAGASLAPPPPILSPPRLAATANKVADRWSPHGRGRTSSSTAAKPWLLLQVAPLCLGRRKRYRVSQIRFCCHHRVSGRCRRCMWLPESLPLTPASPLPLL